jgi:predicted DNA-binding WGR domain protein
MWRWVHPEKARYYQADLIPDLFGGWSVVMAWGSLGSHRGQVRRLWVESHEVAVKRLEEIAKRRRRRGYQSVPAG